MARVLVVEDTPENLLLMSYLLKAFGHEVSVATDGRQGVAMAEQTSPDVVVMDLQMPVMDGFQAASQLRGDPATRMLPLIAVTASAMVGDREKILSAGFDGYIAKPIDPESFVAEVEGYLLRTKSVPPAAAPMPEPRAVAATAAAAEPRVEAGPAAAPPEPDAQPLSVDLRPTGDMVCDAHAVLQQRLRALQQFAAAAAAGRLGVQERREGERQAHRIAGAAASFGFSAATVPARDLERLFSGSTPLESRALGELHSAVHRLGDALAVPSAAVRSTPSPITGRTLRITVMGGADVEERLRDACRGRDITVTRLGAEPALERLIVSSPPHVVVLDVADPTTAPGSGRLARLQELAPTSPILVLAAAEVDRVDLAARGFYGYHDREISGPALLGECLRVVAVHGSGDVTVLAVDDDELVLATVSASLEPAGLRVVHSDRSTGLLDRLDDIHPDLLVLDLDMPDIDGVQLCEMLRASVKWAALPVVFLTSTTGPDSIDRMFNAGADDYVTKPVLGRELLVRVRNRLDRVQLFRRLAETDPLTGLANRRRCQEGVESLLAVARRHLQPLSLVVIDLDHFKTINDTCGHTVGDDVLRGLADMLVEHLRAEDVVGRWGGEEFLIGMYGLNADDAARRLQPLLTEYRARMSVLLPQLTSTFSAGIATYPGEGTTMQQLFVLADERLYEAKEGGRAQIVSGNRPVPAG